LVNDSTFKEALINSIIIASIQTIVALALGLAIAIAIHRVNIRYSSTLEPLIVIPLFISPIIWGFAWSYAYGPSGFIPIIKEFNVAIVGVICGLVHVPHAYALLSSSLISMDATLEEVAMIHGASFTRVMTRVTIPIIRPSLVFSGLLLFILGLEQFGIPLVLLTPYGHEVLTTYIYSIYNLYVINPYPYMASVAAILLSMTISLLIVQRYLALREVRRYVTVGERFKAYHRVPVQTSIKLALLGITVVYVVTVVLIPLASLVLRSIAPLYGTRGGFTLDYYLLVLESEHLRRAIVNTLATSFIAASLGVIVYLSYSWVIQRSRSGLSLYIDVGSTLPRAMPGVVAGLAFLWFYLFTPLRPLMYTYLGLALAYVTVWSVLGSRLVLGSLLQISRELEYVARIHGASMTSTIARIYLPLLRRSLLVAWLYIFILGVREYSIPAFLATGQTHVIGSTLILLLGSGEMGTIAALSTISVLISLALTIAILRLGWKPY